VAEGIDLYTKYQTVTDWRAVARAGYTFAYVKVSDGTSPKDTAGWGPLGKAAGLKMGAYHYAQPGDAVVQANLLCDRAASQGLADLAPALDLEAPFVPGQAAIDFAVTFLRRVKARGYRPCLYGNNSMLTAVRADVLKAVPDTVIWAARYGAAPTVQHDVWQHADNGSVPGISAGSVDLNTGAVPLNYAQSGGAVPSGDQEETEDMSSDVIVGTGVAADQPWQDLVVPVNGHRYLRIASTYGNNVVVQGITMIDDTPGTTGSNGRTVQAGGGVDADRPGPWDLNGADTSFANFSHVVARVKAPAGAKVKAWTNDRA